MIGTTFPASIIGNRHDRAARSMIGTTFPAVDRHDGHHRGRCEPWPWMIGTSFPAVDGTAGTTGTTAAVASRGPG